MINQKGIIHFLPLILLAVVGIVVYILITNIFNFNDHLLSKLYPKPKSFAQEPVETTTIDDNATFYGTYQSHNQKVVQNQYGIFMTYLHQTTSKDTSSEVSTWRLARSTDGGQTFSTIYEATAGTRAPVIETDSNGNIYLIHPDWSSPAPSLSPSPSSTPSPDACLADCSQCATKNTCGATTYDTCVDNLNQSGTNFCKNGATAFRCYALLNSNCVSDVSGGFNYSCSACSSTPASVLSTESGLNTYFYSFSASNNFQNPQISTIPTLGTFLAAKYTMELDEARNQLYYFTINNTFTIIGLDGTLKKQYLLTQNGTSAQMHYPYLYLDENGTLYAAWTTVDIATGSTYWSIHFILSKDGGLSWEKPNGQKLTLPIIADEIGPTDRVTLDDEFTANTWLSTFLVKGGKVHFMYYAREPLNRQHYVRYDLATSKIDLNLYPEFKGETISFSGLDGFCATGLLGQIYCVNRAKNPYALSVLKSDDNGQSWHDHALASQAQNEIYALGGSPQITKDGYIIGSYTESNFSDANSPRVVKFFRVPILSPPPIPAPTPTPLPTPTSTPSPTPSATPIPTQTSTPVLTSLPSPTPAPDTQPPTVPTNLNALAVSSSQINLFWDASTDNVGVSSYDVFRNNVKIANVTTISFGDSGLSASQTYTYFVRALDAAGNISPNSNSVSATTQALPITGNISGTVYSSLGGPLSGVSVKVSANSFKASSTTNSLGNYGILNLKPNDYLVTLSKRGYDTQSYQVYIKAGFTDARNSTLVKK